MFTTAAQLLDLTDSEDIPMFQMPLRRGGPEGDLAWLTELNFF